MEGVFGDYIQILENILDGRSSRPTELPFSLLNYMTNNFSEEREIGSGGFGVVYRGEFKNRNVAVKKLTFSKKADEDFDREIGSLMMVNHDNIVRFLGYCNNTTAKYENVANPGEPERLSFVYKQERILCFEFVCNGSLTAHIHDELRGLEWHTRFKIIKGICQALDYLHNKKKLVHRDLKPDNILLDNLWVPKIADLGISKLLGDGKTQTKTTNVTMSMGYTAPEFKDGVVSFKYDIFSLGIIIIELVTGVTTPPDVKNVLTRWRHRWNNSNETLYDINRDIMYQQVAKCMEIGMSCRKKNPRKRPTISKIIEDLNENHESPAGQETPYWNDLLWVEPPELFFPFQIKKEMSCSVVLINEADAYMAFLIKTNSELQYLVDPNKGVIEPRSHLSVNITLLAQEEALDTMMNLDEFFVKSKKVNEGLTVEDITKDIFSKKLGNNVDKTRLAVVFDEQLRAPCTVGVKKLIDFPSSKDKQQHKSSDDSSLQSCNAYVEINDEEPMIVHPVLDYSSLQHGMVHVKVHDEEELTFAPPNSEDSTLLSGSTHLEVTAEDPSIASTNPDDSFLQSGTTQAEVNDEDLAIASPTPISDDSALRSGPAHGQVNDEEPLISDDSCKEDDEEEPQKNPGVEEPGSMQLVIKYGETVPWKGTFKQRVMLEFTGGDYTSARPGLDLVAVLAVSCVIRDIDWMKEVKTAMRFVLRKLGPIDRLSIVIFTGDDATELCPLRQITEASRLELEELICGLENPGSYSDTPNAMGGLLAGLKVLEDRKVKSGRAAAIMLVASSGEYRCTEEEDAAEVSVRDVPVYIFGPSNLPPYSFGREVCRNYEFLMEVADKSMGGTFSYVGHQLISGGITMALSQCLAGLLTAAVWDLKFTVAAVQDESTLLFVGTRMREYSGRPTTIAYGNVYSREVCSVIVDVGLPTVAVEQDSADILNVTYSYITGCSSSPDGLTVRGGRRVGKSHIVDRYANFEMKKKDRSTRTPRMDTYLEQAKMFYKDPTMPLPSAEDDIKEELGHLTTDVATREKEVCRDCASCLDMED